MKIVDSSEVDVNDVHSRGGNYTMVVGVLKIDLSIPGNRSLKDKRSALKALKDRIRNNFNVSISEVDYHDKWQRASLGVCAVGTDQRYINGILSRVIDLVNGFRQVELLDYQLEML